jgi:hypothetical protein
MLTRNEQRGGCRPPPTPWFGGGGSDPFNRLTRLLKGGRLGLQQKLRRQTPPGASYDRVRHGGRGSRIPQPATLLRLGGLGTVSIRLHALGVVDEPRPALKDWIHECECGASPGLRCKSAPAAPEPLTGFVSSPRPKRPITAASPADPCGELLGVGRATKRAGVSGSSCSGNQGETGNVVERPACSVV